MRFLIAVLLIAGCAGSVPPDPDPAETHRPRADAMVAVSWATVEAARSSQADLPGPVPRAVIEQAGRELGHLFQLGPPGPASLAPMKPRPPDIQLAVDSAAIDSARPRVLLVMHTGDWCRHCNHAEVEAGAKADGLTEFVEIRKLPRGQSPPAGIEGFPTYVLSVDGKQAEKITGRTGWPVLRSKLTASLRQSQTVSAVRVGSIKARPQVLQLIDTMRPLLGNGGSLTFVYKREGGSGEIPLGSIPVTVANNTAIGWAFAGEALKVTVTPPVTVRLGGPRIAVAGVLITPDQLTLDLPWLPDLSLKVTE